MLLKWGFWLILLVWKSNGWYLITLMFDSYPIGNNLRLISTSSFSLTSLSSASSQLAVSIVWLVMWRLASPHQSDDDELFSFSLLIKFKVSSLSSRFWLERVANLNESSEKLYNIELSDAKPPSASADREIIFLLWRNVLGLFLRHNSNMLNNSLIMPIENKTAQTNRNALAITTKRKWVSCYFEFE